LRADDTPVPLLDPGKAKNEIRRRCTTRARSVPWQPAAFADIIARIADHQINRVDDELLLWNWAPIPDQAKAARSARRSRRITLM
jgi:hypothetical protein